MTDPSGIGNSNTGTQFGSEQMRYVCVLAVIIVLLSQIGCGIIEIDLGEIS